MKHEAWNGDRDAHARQTRTALQNAVRRVQPSRAVSNDSSAAGGRCILTSASRNKADIHAESKAAFEMTASGQ